MDRIIEFITNHWELVSVWSVFLALLLWDNNRRKGQGVSTTEATFMINKQDARILDIRDKKDFDTGHLANAINIPYASLAKRMDELNKHKEKPLILVCKTGQTVSLASKMLREKGFNAVRLNGGMMEWTNQNLPVVRS